MSSLIIWYELLKSSKAVYRSRCQSQLASFKDAKCQKRPEYQRRQYKVIFLNDNAPHLPNTIRDLEESCDREPLIHAPYSSDYLTTTCLSKTLIRTKTLKWLDDWFAAKTDQFFSIHCAQFCHENIFFFKKNYLFQMYRPMYILTFNARNKIFIYIPADRQTYFV